MLTLEDVRHKLRYDRESGRFFWDNITPAMAKRVTSGDEAGHTGHHGYRFIRINYHVVLAHRLAWFYVYGEWPDRIDHIDGNTGNNRIENLRRATHTENMRNSKKPKNNRSGYKGVSIYKPNGMWRARIGIGDGKGVTLGYYKTPEEAYARYCEEAKKIHGEFARAA